MFGFGNIEQQAFQQLGRRRLVEPDDALLEQALELLVGVLEQAAQRRTVGDDALAHALDQRRGDLPQRAQRRVAAQCFETAEDFGQIAKVRLVVLFAQQPDQSHLQHLPQFAQHVRQIGRFQRGECRVAERRQLGQWRAEQAGFRQQAFTASAAQIVDQRQHHQRQVAAGALHAVEVKRQLPQGLQHQVQGFVAVWHALMLQGFDQMLHFFGEQRCAVELDHLQTAVDLMNVGQALVQPGEGLRIVEHGLDRLMRQLQRFGNFALDPFQGHVVVPITHNHSTHALSVAAGKVKPDTERRN